MSGDQRPALDFKCTDILLTQINVTKSIATVIATLTECVCNVTLDNIDIIIHNLDVLGVLLCRQTTIRSATCTGNGHGSTDNITTLSADNDSDYCQDLPSQAGDHQNFIESNDFHTKVTTLVIIPLLNSLNSWKLSSNHIRRVCSSIVIVTTELCSYPNCLHNLVNVSYQMIKESTANSKFSDCADHDNESTVVLMHLELLTRILEKCGQDIPWYQTIREQLLNESSRIMLLADEKIVGQLLGSLLPVLIGDTPKDTDINLIWNTVLSCSHNCRCTAKMESLGLLSERAIFLVCSVADIFFPATGFSHDVLILLLGPDIWHIIQSGVFHESSLTRKRAMYLLKRLLDVIQTQNIELIPEECEQPRFWWTDSQKTQLSELWMNYILLVETLEEKQVKYVFFSQKEYVQITTINIFKKSLSY